ncbi:MAG: Mn2+-dependent serine/threonine protein kinase [uncultured bacterium]|nr:MAG: Mn2+-dependent serine/threonine protein kinase [uncultured bacterium]
MSTNNKIFHFSIRKKPFKVDGALNLEFLNPELFVGGFNQILDSIKDMKVLKNGEKTEIGTIESGLYNINKDKILVKKIKYSGRIKKLSRKIIGSRARYLFKTSFILLKKGIHVPVPYAYFDNFKNNESYFLSSCIDNAINLGELFLHKDIPSFDFTKLAKSVYMMHSKHCVHGDLKWSNLMIRSDGEIFFIDLDNASHTKSKDINGIRKDLIRFYRFALEVEKEKEIKELFFNEYFNLCSKSDINAIKPDYIYKTAFTQWEKNGKRKLN